MKETKQTTHEIIKDLLEDKRIESYMQEEDEHAEAYTQEEKVEEKVDTATLLEAVVNKTLTQILSGELAFENAAEFQQTVHTATHYLEGRNA